MGRASRGKKRVKGSGLEQPIYQAGAGEHADQSLPFKSGFFNLDMFAKDCMSAAIEAVKSDDLNALKSWVGLFERASEESFLDQSFSCVADDGGAVQLSVLLLATHHGASDCACYLLLEANRQNHPSYMAWMHKFLPAYERMPLDHPLMNRLAGILEKIFVPDDREAAFKTLDMACDCGPRLSVLVRKVASRWLSEFEKKEIDQDVEARRDLPYRRRTRL